MARYRPVSVDRAGGATRRRRDLQATALWQFSDRDFFIAPMSAIELARAAPGDPTMEWYGADHAMRSAKARASRTRFLEANLELR